MHKGESSHIDHLSQQDLVAALKANDESVMKALYTATFPKVKTFILQNSGSVSEAKDIYQEAFIAVWRNIRREKFTPQGETALSGYLFQIAKYKWFDYLRSDHHKKTVSENELHTVPFHSNEEEKEDNRINTENIKQITDAFNKLGGPCKSLLNQFYFKQKSCRELARELDMQEASVRNKKYRCMQMLRKLVQESNNK